MNFIDPYDMKKTEFDYGMDLSPNIVYPDIVSYLLFAQRPYTAEQLKCFKAIDLYNYFVGAKILVTYVYLLGGSVIPKRCVKHLQLHGI